jgi:galactose mutarotase-like enzyme
VHPLLGAWECRFRGEPAVELRNGPLRAVFAPGIGMTGMSLRFHAREHLVLPGGLDALRSGHTGGLPLLAPWANRLAGMRYRVGGRTVDLAGLGVHTDDNGLPIHGLLVGRPGWRVLRLTHARGAAVVRAALDVDEPAFPFPHRLEVEARAHEDRLVVTTTLVATGRRSVPVAFGWHPYLRVPGSARHAWHLRLPRREHLVLDGRGIPTGERVSEPGEAAPLARRTFDDLYALGTGRVFGLEAPDGAAIELRPDGGYRYTQVWVPPGKQFVALEPMTAATDALTKGAVPLVAPGESHRARFSLVVRA